MTGYKYLGPRRGYECRYCGATFECLDGDDGVKMHVGRMHAREEDARRDREHHPLRHL